MFAANSFLTIILGTAVAAIFVAIGLAWYALKQEKGNEKMEEVSKAVQEGANAYLKRQFKTIAPIIVILAVFIYISAPIGSPALGRTAAFLLGAVFSAAIGTFGMNIAT
ncbi:MAG: sodium/proton-translocating pyrophosphatase, partial [Candidatus Woesebacteria bacterium]|nr:sodium/proton-translocating pyrophosphatase [Candidatus Woesebacteria bacterium]